MALLFSAVTVTAGEDEIELLVGGIPREYDDLEGWSEFDDLMYFISEETEVSVRAEAYRYGEGESMSCLLYTSGQALSSESRRQSASEASPISSASNSATQWSY